MTDTERKEIQDHVDKLKSMKDKDLATQILIVQLEERLKEKK